jgi:hypothetical protein
MQARPANPWPTRPLAHWTGPMSACSWLAGSPTRPESTPALPREVLADIDWITASLDALEGEITTPWPRPRWPICSRLVDVAPLTAAKIVGNDWCHQVQQSRATSEALAGADLIFAGALVLAFHTSSDESARTAARPEPRRQYRSCLTLC